MKPPKYKPAIFIGSSSEGLGIARHVKALLAADSIPTLWEDDLFLPSTIPLEILEEQLDRHAFALLVATADDVLVKRQTVADTLRDNVLFECGLFMGALGRRRTFLLVPKDTHVELPTDLKGLSIAKYDSSEPGYGDSLKAATETIVLAMRAEWRRMQNAGAEFARKEMLGAQYHAIRQLLTLCDRLLDIVLKFPHKAIVGLRDRNSFELSKRGAIQQVTETSRLWSEFATLLGVEKEYFSLIETVIATINAVPFYREVKITDQPEIQLRDLPLLKRIWSRMKGGKEMDPDVKDFVRRLKLEYSPNILRMLRASGREEDSNAEREIDDYLALLSFALEKWWSDYGTELIVEIRKFQSQIIKLMQAMLYTDLKA